MAKETVLIDCKMIEKHSEKCVKAYLKDNDIFTFIPKSVIINFNKVTQKLQIEKWFAKEKGLLEDE